MRRARSPDRKPLRRYHHGDLRRALLDEALATIRNQGVAGLTLRDIAARLGVSRTALYRHFADKGALLEAVATEGFRTLRERLVTAWEEGGRGLAAFDAMGAAYIAFALASPSHYRVMFGGAVGAEARGSELAAEGEGAFHALVDALGALQRVGLVRGDDTSTMASYVWAAVHGVAMLGIDGQLRDPAGIEPLARYAIDAIKWGIGAPPDRSSGPAGRRLSGSRPSRRE